MQAKPRNIKSPLKYMIKPTHSIAATERPLLAFHMHHFAGFNFSTRSYQLCLYKQW